MVPQFLVQAVMCFPSTTHGNRVGAEGEGFGIGPVGFEVLMDFFNARYAGLELRTGPGFREATEPRIWMRSPQIECIPQGKQRVDVCSWGNTLI